MEKEMRTKKLETLKETVSVCTRCPLCQSKTNAVFGKGSADAAILFVGEAPGEKEDLSGIPFVGPAGKLLDDYLTAVGLEEKDYYVANILKCRPPNNRDPFPEEADACLPYLREQLRILSPKILVCLGRIAAQRIISPDFRITSQHGIWYEQKGFRVIATFHPSALLRDPSKRMAALQDFKKIADALK